ncbi:MAG: phosphatidylinositol mannoside acyltransferase [Candidatus Nanopelagicales bacterium]|nr:phosphatidylinositol mannoside acyltransferase [Candidatus Nanopelagicales bacterium]
MTKTSFAGRITDASFGAGWTMIRRMPEPVAAKVFSQAGNIMWRRQGQSVRQLRANLARVLPPDRLNELDDLTYDGIQRYLRYWREAFRLPSMSAAEVAESFTLDAGLDRLDAIMDEGKGAVIALPHMGNWDHAGAWATARYGSLTTVAEQLKPASLYDRFVEYRETLGMEILPLGGTNTVRELAERLRQGRLICLLADRDLQGSGIDVEFFGGAATMPPGPAMLSLMTGAPLLPVTTWHTDEGTSAVVGAPLRVDPVGNRAEQTRALTQQLAIAFEDSIRAHPADWHMMQRLWHEDVRLSRTPGNHG